jgi:lipid-A-disaccharide synthase
MTDGRRNVMFIAGDPSGDEHASHIVAHVKAGRPDVECVGIGGPSMQAAGLKPLLPFAPFNRMGLAEVIPSLVFFARARRLLARHMRTRRPEMLVLIDYAGFNIPMMHTARRLGVPVLWYITPKVWAWKKGRAKTLGENATWIACILPFERRLFEGHSAKVLYVGNPSVEALDRRRESRPLNKKHPPSGAGKWRVALVPGSRRQEVVRILPLMCKAASLLRKAYPVDIKVSVYRGLDRGLFEPCLQTHDLQEHTGRLDELLEWADVGIITSGTATLEAALMGVPHVLVYRTSLLNYLAYKCVVRFPFIGLPNIIAGKPIIPELLQSAAAADSVVREVARFIEEPRHFEAATEALESLRIALGDKKPSVEVAGLILETAAAA